jgi:hypothetical protein
MTNLYDFAASENFGPLWAVRTCQAWALQRLISLNWVSGDLRWAILALALRSFTPVWGFAQRQMILLLRKGAGRIWQRTGFRADATDADSMVAAGAS